MRDRPLPSAIELLDVASGRADATRYGLAVGAVILIVLAAAQMVPAPPHEVDTPSEIDNAVIVDLPAASAAASRGEAGRDETARQAIAATAVAPSPQPPRPAEAPPEAEPAPVEPAPPPPVAEVPAAVLERVAPPLPPTPEAVPPQEARTTAGADTERDKPVVADEVGQPHASAHALTLWQKAMAMKLQAAKRAVPRRAGGSGTVQVAFTIDRDGHVVAQKVDRTSGNASLDAAAATLVRKAAPYPPPPAGANDADLTFTVPIRFRR